MAYNVEKLHALENALRTTAELVGEKATLSNQDGVKVGLDLTNEALICTNAAESINEGIFKVIVMGTYATGKSTIVNALIGSRVLPEAITPSTAIISFLRYGQDGDNVTVYFSDGTTEVLSYSDFQEKYKYTNEDAEEARRTGEVKRFSNMDFLVIHSNMELLRNGVQVVDSPGIGDELFAEKTLKLANTANAIIYTTTASAGGFNQNDQEFFKSNFEGRSLNNVFFIINKADQLEEAELDQVKKYHKTQLEYVFKNGEGVFDEQLYSKRVFYVSAKYMFDQKTGQHSRRYDDTYNPEFERFEKELEEFLTTDARSTAIFNSCFAKMANAYNAIDCIVKNINSYKNDIISIEQRIQFVENVVANLDNDFEIRKNELLTIIDRVIAKLVDDIKDISYLEMKNIIVSSGLSISDIISTKWPDQYIINKERRTIEFEQKMTPVVQQIIKLLEHKVEQARNELEELTYPINQELTNTIRETEKLLNELGLQIHQASKKGEEEVLYNPVRLDPSNNVIYSITNPHTIQFDKIAWLLLKEWVINLEGKDNTDETFYKSINEYLGISYIISQLTMTLIQNFEDVKATIDGFLKLQNQLFESIKENRIDADRFSQKAIQENKAVLRRIWDCANEAYQIVFEKDISLKAFRKMGNK